MTQQTPNARPSLGEIGGRVGRWLESHVSAPVERNHTRILVVAGALLVAVVGYLNPGTFLNSISAELFGIVIAAVVVDAVNERRQQQHLKEQLIRQMGMNIREVAVPAAYELAHRKWLFDGSLNGANLVQADLRQATLPYANLSGAQLLGANLSGIDLRCAILSRARLSEAILAGADLSEANFSGADMNLCDLSNTIVTEANLKGTTLWKANLKGAFFGKVDLSGAFLQEAELVEVMLPGAVLNEADLWEADMSKANLRDADMCGATRWTIQQLEATEFLVGTVMPDGVQLVSATAMFSDDTSRTRIAGTTFEEWKQWILAQHGGTDASVRSADGSVIEL